MEAGWTASLASERVGRATSSPPQFGHVPPSTVVAQSAQNVHSNEQMPAPAARAGRSLSQHSQFGGFFKLLTYRPKAFRRLAAGTGGRPCARGEIPMIPHANSPLLRRFVTLMPLATHVWMRNVSSCGMRKDGVFPFGAATKYRTGVAFFRFRLRKTGL